MDSLDAPRGTTWYAPGTKKLLHRRCILPEKPRNQDFLKTLSYICRSFVHRISAGLVVFTKASVDLTRERERMDLDNFLMHQLNNKFINQPVLIDRLIIANINNHNPQDFFPGDRHGITKECYVLTPRSYYLYGLVFRPDRRAGNGYWKGTAPGNVILGMDGLVGVKKNLSFYEGDQSQSHGLQTNWKMIEYRLQQHICSITCDHKSGRLDNWVLCKIYEDFGPEALFSQMERMNI